MRRALGNSLGRATTWTASTAASLTGGVSIAILAAQVSLLAFGAIRGALAALGWTSTGGGEAWISEVVTQSLPTLGFLGAALAVRTGAHQALDCFAGKLSPRHDRVLVVFSHVAVAAFGIALLALGLEHVEWCREQGGALASLPIPRWPFYAAYPVSGALMALFAIEKLAGEARTTSTEAEESAANRGKLEEEARP